MSFLWLFFSSSIIRCSFKQKYNKTDKGDAAAFVEASQPFYAEGNRSNIANMSISSELTDRIRRPSGWASTCEKDTYKNYNLISWQTFLIDKFYIDKRQCNWKRQCLRWVEIPKRSAGSNSPVCSYSLRFYLLFLFLETHPNMPYGLFSLRLCEFLTQQIHASICCMGFQLPGHACVYVRLRLSFLSSSVFGKANLL